MYVCNVDYIHKLTVLTNLEAEIIKKYLQDQVQDLDKYLYI